MDIDAASVLRFVLGDDIANFVDNRSHLIRTCASKPTNTETVVPLFERLASVLCIALGIPSLNCGHQSKSVLSGIILLTDALG
ncbi:hypothetical protein DJ75_00710 [Halorubrum sp. Eb13]|nr:hypothetical protein DJ75_00710 [Halorubrum sp. Eb13]